MGTDCFVATLCTQFGIVAFGNRISKSSLPHWALFAAVRSSIRHSRFSDRMPKNSLPHWAYFAAIPPQEGGFVRPTGRRLRSPHWRVPPCALTMTTGLLCHCEEAFRPTKQSVISINDLDVKQYKSIHEYCKEPPTKETFCLLGANGFPLWGGECSRPAVGARRHPPVEDKCRRKPSEQGSF